MARHSVEVLAKIEIDAPDYPVAIIRFSADDDTHEIEVLEPLEWKVIDLFSYMLRYQGSAVAVNMDHPLVKTTLDQSDQEKRYLERASTIMDQGKYLYYR